MRIIAVDFDGTIVDHRYPEIGPWVPGAVETMQDLQREGVKLILWTIRSGVELQAAVDHCATEGIEFWGVNKNPTQKNWSQSPKAYAQLFIDDAALGAPLINIPGFERDCISWSSVRSMLRDKGFLNG